MLGELCCCVGVVCCRIFLLNYLDKIFLLLIFFGEWFCDGKFIIGFGIINKDIRLIVLVFLVSIYKIEKSLDKWYIFGFLMIL